MVAPSGRLVNADRCSHRRGTVPAAAGTLVALALLCASPRAHTPHDTVNRLAISPTFASDGTLFAVLQLSEHAVFGRSTDGGRSWDAYGLAMIQHSVLSLAMSPVFAVDGIAFAGTKDAGVWRTADGGTTWAPANTGLGSLDVRDIAVSPRFDVDGRVLLATANGCWSSTDGGLSWSAANTGLTEADVARVAFAEVATVFVGGAVLHRSDDGGGSWQALAAVGGTMVTLAVSPSYGTDTTIAVSAGTDVLVSVDGGASLAPSVSGLTDPEVNDIAFANDGTLFAATKTAGCFTAPGPFQPWSLGIAGLEELSDQTTSHFRRVVPSPTFAADGTVFLGAYEGLFRSDNGGASWRQRDLYPQRVNRAITISPDFAHDRMLLLANFGGGLALTVDGNPDAPDVASSDRTPVRGRGPGSGSGSGSGGGASNGAGLASGTLGAIAPPPAASLPLEWLTRGDGITNLFTFPIAASPDFADDDTLFIGHVGLYRSTNRGRDWVKLTLPPGITLVRGVALSPSFATDDVIVFGTAEQGVWKSEDRGDTWFAADTALPSNLRTKEIAFSPDWATDQTLFIASRNQSVFRSTDGGASWTSTGAGITDGSSRVLEVSPDFATDGTVFVGTRDDGLFVSDDGGLSWTTANVGLPDLTGIDVEGLVLSPDFANDRTAFVALQRGGVFRSVDGGRTWSPASEGLAPSMPWDLVISPSYAVDRTLFLSTYDWIWRSTNGGASWSRVEASIRVPDDHPQVFFSGGWSPRPLPDCHGSGVTLSNVTGAWTELEFHGRTITWYATLDDNSGLADVLLDGAPVATLDLYRAQPLHQQPVWSATFTDPGWHTVRIVVKGTAHPASLDVRVLSDGFEVTD